MAVSNAIHSFRRRVCRLTSLGFVALLLVALPGTGGCRNPELAKNRRELRRRHIAYTADVAAQSERIRPVEVAQTTSEVCESERQRSGILRRNADKIDAQRRRDWQRWIERQPVYREHLIEVFGGKPDGVEPSAIILFF
jgi:hypothetical protein